MKIHNYKFIYDGDYIIGFYATLKEDYDFVGQMAQYRDVVESCQYGGYYKFVNGEFVLDEERKALKLKEYEEKNATK